LCNEGFSEAFDVHHARREEKLAQLLFEAGGTTGIDAAPVDPRPSSRDDLAVCSAGSGWGKWILPRPRGMLFVFDDPR